MNSTPRRRRWLVAGWTLALSLAATTATIGQIARPPASRGGDPPGSGAQAAANRPQRPPSPFGGTLNRLRMRLEGGGMFGGRGGRPGPGAGGPLSLPTSINGDLLDYPLVRKEIKLTKAQETAVNKIKEDSSAKSREIWSRFRPQRRNNDNNGQNPQNFDPQARAVQFAQMGESMRLLHEETEREIGRVLTKPQAARLFQITLQIQGASAVVRPDMIRRLGLSEEQVVAVMGILEQLNQARGELFQSMRGMFGRGRGGRGGNNDQGPGRNAAVPTQAERDAALKTLSDRGDKLRSEANQAIGGVLDSGQRKAFTKMMGKPFDLKALDADASMNQNQRGGSGGPGGPPNRGGNAPNRPAPPPVDD